MIVRLHVRALEGFGMWAGDSYLGADAVVWTDDYCDIRLPPDFLRGNPESFKLEWVDFYQR